MSLNVDITNQFPAAYKAQVAFDGAVERAAKEAGLQPALIELVKIRVSQLNGCAFCLLTHTRDALSAGETPDRLAVLPAWWESRYFSAQEEAALTLAESVTEIGDLPAHAPSRVDVQAVLTDQQIAAVTWIAIVVNGWNRIAISSHYPVEP